MKDIKVSVVCLAYNHKLFIEKMLYSLVSQHTSFDYEILIHDDASTDDTQSIIKKYEMLYPEVIKPIYQTDNKYSKGIDPNEVYNYPRAQGKYIAFCEGDDYWSDPDKLQSQYDIMESHQDCSICVHGTQCISKDGAVVNRYFPPIEINQGIISSQDYFHLELATSCWIFQTSSYFIRASVLHDYLSEYKNQYPVGDLPIVLYSLLKGNCYYLKKNMSCYRLESGGYMSNLNKNDKAIQHQQRMIKGHIYFDQFSNYKYHTDFQIAISKCEFQILYMQHNYWELCNRKYFSIIKTLRRKKKLVILLGLFLPRLARMVDKNI